LGRKHIHLRQLDEHEEAEASWSAWPAKTSPEPVSLN
jgi:hypothetical protein